MPAYINFGGSVLKQMTFNGGEPHVKVVSRTSTVEVICIARNFNDIGELLVLTDAIKRNGSSVELTLPYFPGARQDRYLSGEALTAKVYADLINAQKYKKVTIWDPHSDVTPALIDNCVVIPQDYFAKQVHAEKGLTTIVAPDAGAAKKASKVAEHYQVPLAIATKTRNMQTGELGQPELHTEALTEDVLVVDDICDGGGTFIQLAPILRSKGARNLRLYVTHGIFSKGLDELLKHYDHIYTTDSFYDGQNTDKITVIKGTNDDEI